jgi:hypothetical protein
MTMMCVPEPEVRALLRERPVKLLDASSDASAGPRTLSRTYFVTNQVS